MQEDKLTIEILKAMKPDTIFAQGEVVDAPRGANMANTGNMLKWVAVRGGIHDWAVYIDNPYSPQWSFEGVRDMGDKVHNPEIIRRLVPCTDEAFKMYRH